MPRIAGIDGCKMGWIAVYKEIDGDRLCWIKGHRVAELLSYIGEIEIVGIDIPIGLMEKGPRECDREARQLLGNKRGSSVFPAPIRTVLNAGDYREACDLREKIEGKKMSKQAWAIVDKIKEVDVLLRTHPRLNTVIHEIHPEVSFCLMGNHQPNYYSKKKNQGMEERIRKLSLHFKIDLAYVKRKSIEHKVLKDDIVDALAALWSADRIFQGKHMLLPAVDNAGQPRIYA